MLHKSKSAVFLVISGLILTSCIDGSSSTDSRNALIYNLQFEGNGVQAFDTSGYDNHGTIYGANRATGKIGNGIRFYEPGKIEFKSPYFSSYNLNETFQATNSISIDAWINVAELTSDNIYHIVGGGYDGMRLQINNGYLQFLYYFSDWVEIISSNTKIKTNEWTHVSVTYDGTIAHIYINGIEDSVSSIIHPFPNWNNIFFIGSEASTGVLTNSYIGAIDELRIYDIKLSAEEIQSYYEDTL